MSIYQLPDFKFPQLKKPNGFPKFWQRKYFFVAFLIVISFIFGALGAISAVKYFPAVVRNLLKIEAPVSNTIVNQINQYTPATSQEEAIINTVKETSPAVVSIIVSKNLPVYEQCYTNPFGDFFPGFQIPDICQKGTELQEIGGGSGFIISSEGQVLTNKHVVSDTDAEYTVLTNDGKKYPAKVLALDPSQDFAIIQINEIQESLPTVKLGNSDQLQIGQTVIAIGNALGEFRNTVSVGVISGLSRTITASGGGVSETIEDVIQTDAAINPGNSGGPLLNLKGEVIGINTAIVSGAQNVSFSIPINKAKRDIEQFKATGKITYPFLGVRTIAINETIKQENNLPVDYGAWIQKGANGEAAVTSGSPAQTAGLKEGDIILEFSGQKITAENTLSKIIAKYNPGDEVTLKTLRNGKEMKVQVTLSERK
ncbi:MAG: trypsin-like peptidase domain-containing protein [Candidatus Pacebacteria bacterium]|nr:trypsin-like peptidase domain-containing protein [Candidatus Paceibacterota bacterium]